MNGYKDVNFRGNSHMNSLNDTQFNNDSRIVYRSTSSSDYRPGESGPHREMAIDCPASFVGVKKEPPRLPRPLSSVMHGTLTGSSKGSSASLSKGQTVSSYGANQSNGARVSTISTVDGSGVAVSGQTPSTRSTFERDERDRSERYRRHQEEIARRKEMEERVSQQQELLRASLRGSKKMQDLAERKARAHALTNREGFDNPTYRTDDDEQLRVNSTVLSSASSADADVLGQMSKYCSDVDSPPFS